MLQYGFNTPFGPLTVTEVEDTIVSLDWGWPRTATCTLLLRAAEDQLSIYFRGDRRVFNLPLAPRGTAFQRRVWGALCAIPFGSTCSYGVLAAELGTAARAIGGACARNPIPILIPCHRVIAANGRLGGYSGSHTVGGEIKQHLLNLESMNNTKINVSRHVSLDAYRCLYPNPRYSPTMESSGCATCV